MICPNCQKEYFRNEKFCIKCGTRLVEKTEPVPAPAPAAPVQPAPAPVQPEPIQEAPAFGSDEQATVMHDSAPAVAAPVSAPVVSAPVQPAPVQPAPVQPAPVQPAPIQPTPVQEAPAFGSDEQATVMHDSAPAVAEPVSAPVVSAPIQPAPVQPAPIQPEPVQPAPAPAAPVQANSQNPAKVPEIQQLNPMPENDIKTTKKVTRKKSSNAKIVVLAVVAVLMLVLLAGIGFFAIKRGMFSKGLNKGKDNKPVIEERESIVEEIEPEDENNLQEIEALLAEADELTELGMEQVGEDETVYDGLNHLESAIDAYLEKLPEIGDADYLTDRIDMAYSAYQTAVYTRVSILNENAIGGVDTGARFDQMMEDLKHAIAIGDEIEAAGFEVDYEDMETLADEVRTEYSEKVIEEFNTYTDEKLVDGNWSRTEAYHLMCGNEDMAGTEGMFDADDFDDPIHTRYCFALAYYQTKLLNKAVHEEKTQTPGAAAQSIAGILPAVDYSPLLVSQYIGFLKEAELDYGEAEAALNDVKAYLNDDYGIDIDVIGWEHFWYFNELGSDSSQTVADGAWNGVTSESRQWIRNRLAAVSY